MTQVGLVARTADDHVGAMLPAERDGQPGPRGDRDVAPVCGKFPAQLGRPFRLAAGRLLIAVDSHEHGDPREKMPCPLDDVEMAGCNGVEGAGIDRMLPQPAPAGRIEHRPRLRAISSAELTPTIELQHDGRAELCGPFRCAGDGCPTLARGAGITRRGWPRTGPVSR